MRTVFGLVSFVINTDVPEMFAYILVRNPTFFLALSQILVLENRNTKQFTVPLYTFPLFFRESQLLGNKLPSL